MRKVAVILWMLLLIAGCRAAPADHQAVIDWVDFIKWNGVEYSRIHSGVLADEQAIGKQIGSVKFAVADHITSPDYQIKDGDAAFHARGTKLYEVEESPGLLAVKDAGSINGYKVYFPRKMIDYKWHFQNVQLDRVHRAEIYQTHSPGLKKLRELTGKAAVPFLQLLKESKEVDYFYPDTANGDPASYTVILYTDEPVAYKYEIQFDGTNYFWYPWDAAILSNEIGSFFQAADVPS